MGGAGGTRMSECRLQKLFAPDRSGSGDVLDDALLSTWIGGRHLPEQVSPGVVLEPLGAAMAGVLTPVHLQPQVLDGLLEERLEQVAELRRFLVGQAYADAQLDVHEPSFIELDGSVVADVVHVVVAAQIGSQPVDRVDQVDLDGHRKVAQHAFDVPVDAGGELARGINRECEATSDLQISISC